MDATDRTIEEASTQLRLSKRTIRRYLKKGLFPNATQLEQQWRIPQTDIDAYLDRNRVKSKGERGAA